MNLDALDEFDSEETEAIRARDLWQMVRFVRPFALPYRRSLLVLALVLLVETVFNFGFPLASQYLVDEGLIERNADVVVGVLAFLGAAAVVVTLTGLAC